jgi:hypothetical protein
MAVDAGQTAMTVLGGASGLASEALPIKASLTTAEAAKRLVEIVAAHSGEAGTDQRVDWGASAESAYRRVTLKDPVLEAIAVHFYEGRRLQEQTDLIEALKQSPFYPLVERTMLSSQVDRLTPSDWTRCVTKTPGPEYFMLCDDAELGTGPDGAMDGDLKIRRRCVSWRLILLGTLEHTFVEFSGMTPSGETEGLGVMYMMPGTAGSSVEASYIPVYCFENDAPAPVLVQTTPDQEKEQKMVAELLSGLADSFENGLNPAPLAPRPTALGPDLGSDVSEGDRAQVNV